MKSLLNQTMVLTACFFLGTMFAQGEMNVTLGRGDSQLQFLAAQSTVSVRLAGLSDRATMAEFIGQSDLFDTAAPIAALGDGFYQVTLGSGRDYATVIDTLRANPAIAMVNPVLQYGSGAYMADRSGTVRFLTGVSREVKDSLHNVLGSTFLESDSRSVDVDHVLVRCDRSKSVFDILDEYYQFAECEYASPSLWGQATSHSADPLFSNQWHFENTGQSGGTSGADIDATNAWKISRGDSNVTVAIIEPEGFEWLSHPDLGPSCHIDGWDMFDTTRQPWECPPSGYCDGPDYRPDGDEWHGTAILGELAARSDNDTGVAGLAPECGFYCLKMGDNGRPNEETMIAALRKAWLPPVNARIVTCSWEWGIDPDIAAEIHDMLDHGVSVFFSTGNKHPDSTTPPRIRFPATVAYAVSATNHSDSLTTYSARGPGVDLVAPGGDNSVSFQSAIWTTDLPDSGGGNHHPTNCGGIGMDYQCNFTGTSAAVPLAAGVAALVFSVRPDYMEIEDSNAVLWNVLCRSAEDKGPPGYDTLYGHGRINAFQALLSVSRGNANGGRVWDIADAVETLYQANETYDPLIHKGLSDLNCDGAVDSIDVRMIMDVVFHDLPLPDTCFTFDY